MSERKSSTVTLEQIAQECGVSKATVSLALRNRGSISRETAKRIQDVSRQIGYKRPPVSKGAANGQGSQHARQVALPFNEASLDTYHRHNFFEYIAGISEGMTAAGITFHLRAFRGAEKEFDFVQALLERNEIDGLINLEFCPRTTDYLLAKKIPMVGMSENVAQYGIPCILPNKVKGYIEAWEYVKSMGHTNVAFIGFNVDQSLRLKQCRAGAALVDTLEFLKQVIFIPRTSLAMDVERHLKEAFASLRREEWPTLIFAQSDLMAYNLITALQIMGLKVPDDISVIGFDDVPIAAQCTPPLTTLKLPFFQMGLCAAHLLTSIINGEHKNTGLHYSLPVELVIRGSVRSLASAPDGNFLINSSNNHNTY